jgi:hypothetical protein
MSLFVPQGITRNPAQQAEISRKPRWVQKNSERANSCQ